MGRPYSQDLRERVLEAAAVTSHRQAAVRFEVGIATSIRWMAALTTTAPVAARPQGRAAARSLIRSSPPLQRLQPPTISDYNLCSS